MKSLENNRLNLKREREQTTIRLPVDLKEEIQRRADELNVSFNTMLIMLARRGLLG